MNSRNINIIFQRNNIKANFVEWILEWFVNFSRLRMNFYCGRISGCSSNSCFSHENVSFLHIPKNYEPNKSGSRGVEDDAMMLIYLQRRWSDHRRVQRSWRSYFIVTTRVAIKLCCKVQHHKNQRHNNILQHKTWFIFTILRSSLSNILRLRGNQSFSIVYRFLMLINLDSCFRAISHCFSALVCIQSIVPISVSFATLPLDNENQFANRFRRINSDISEKIQIVFCTSNNWNGILLFCHPFLLLFSRAQNLNS